MPYLFGSVAGGATELMAKFVSRMRISSLAQMLPAVPFITYFSRLVAFRDWGATATNVHECPINLEAMTYLFESCDKDGPCVYRRNPRSQPSSQQSEDAA